MLSNFHCILYGLLKELRVGIRERITYPFRIGQCRICKFVIYLTPLIPLSFKGEREEIGRGASPLFNTPRWFGFEYLPPL